MFAETEHLNVLANSTRSLQSHIMTRCSFVVFLGTSLSILLNISYKMVMLYVRIDLTVFRSYVVNKLK